MLLPIIMIVVCVLLGGGTLLFLKFSEKRKKAKGRDNFPFASAMSKSRFRSRAMRYGTDEQIPPTFFHWSCCHPACMSEKRRSVKTGQLPARP